MTEQSCVVIIIKGHLIFSNRINLQIHDDSNICFHTNFYKTSYNFIKKTNFTYMWIYDNEDCIGQILKR